MPEARAHVGVGAGEVYLEDEAAFEGGIEEGFEVGGGYEDALEVLESLEDDVLDAVVHLPHGGVGVFESAADDGIGLVKEEDGGGFVFEYLSKVLLENQADVLLALAHPLVVDLAHVGLEDFASCGVGQLVDGLGFAGSRGTVEEAGEARLEACVPEATVDLAEGVFLEEGDEFVVLSLHVGGEEELLCGATEGRTKEVGLLPVEVGGIEAGAAAI